MRCTLQASGVDLKWHMVKPITVVSDSNRLRAAVLKALLWTSAAPGNLLEMHILSPTGPFN